MDDITLTFNPNMFLSSLEKITMGLETITNKFDAFADSGKKTSQKVDVSTKSMVKGFVLLKGVLGGIQGALRKIPEIGRTFSIVGDIISRNLLWPLRQQLIPELQKMLDWVRDNRMMFVRWGNVVRNVFIVIKNIVSGVMNIIKKFWESFSQSVERVFGKTTQRMTDLANLLVFKIAAVVNFLFITLEPIASFIGRIFGVMLESAKAFIEGLMNGLGDLGPELSELVDMFSRIASLISGTGVKVSTLTGAFKILGNIIGAVVGPAIRSIVQLLDSVIAGVEIAVNRVQYFQAWRKDNVIEMNRLNRDFDETQRKHNQRTRERWQRQMQAWKQTGSEVAETSGDIARGSMQKVTNNKAVTTTTTQSNDITINIDGSKSPELTGKEVTRAIKNELQNTRAKAGRARP